MILDLRIVKELSVDFSEVRIPQGLRFEWRFGSAMPESPGRVLSVRITIWDNTEWGNIAVIIRQAPIWDESVRDIRAVRWLIWMGMWRVRGRINPKTQVQKPNPGAPSASLKVVSGLSIWPPAQPTPAGTFRSCFESEFGFT